MYEIDKEYKNDIMLKKEDVKRLEAWVSSQPHLPNLSEHEALWFLQSRYYQIEAAKVAIDKYYTIRTRTPEMFSTRSEQTIREQSEMSVMHMLARENHEGYRIFYMIVTEKTSDKFSYLEEVNKLDAVFSLELLQNGTQNGVRVVFDVDRVSAGVLKRLHIKEVKTAVQYIQDAVPVRMKGIHIVNVKPFVNAVFTMCKPFMNKEIVEKIHFHKDIKDLTKFVPIECLPSDYGGKDKSVEVFREKMLNNLLENQEYFKYRDEQRVDESKRSKKSNST